MSPVGGYYTCKGSYSGSGRQMGRRAKWKGPLRESEHQAGAVYQARPALFFRFVLWRIFANIAVSTKWRPLPEHPTPSLSCERSGIPMEINWLGGLDQGYDRGVTFRSFVFNCSEELEPVTTLFMCRLLFYAAGRSLRWTSGVTS